MTEGILVLSNGRSFRGRLRGEIRPTQGEVIFHTGITGYQEILTDPSYAGQIVTMTYPHIGNYGINSEDMESKGIHAAGLIVKELSEVTSNWRADQSLEEWLKVHKISVLEGIDTRALVKTIRDQGACPGIIAPVDSSFDLRKLENEARQLPLMEGQNLAKRVSTPEIFHWQNQNAEPRFRVFAYDFGIKYNILKSMARLGIATTVVPYSTPMEEVLEMKPDGVFLSNGPGDPSAVHESIQAVKKLLGKFPIFGICLGHQILSLALGCETYKLKFGHHGANHPVLDYRTEKVEITSQNHGFSVDESSLPPGVRVTHRNLNDQTVEGLEALDYPAYSVQYHPEAAPGPHDAQYLFNRFVEMMAGSNSA
ncbi:MAG: glutamine-hydrolyzing carbamoyl-phosphate synthase small subunit [SAR324 cluster bacterium]|nr:glutamine-hydrolyzing carbamoyl-phosphate synthase small subunit [SAR324 cluster bacterium]